MTSSTDAGPSHDTSPSSYAAPTPTTAPHSRADAGLTPSRPTRSVACPLELRTDGPAHFALAVAVASHLPVRQEQLVVSIDGEPSPAVREIAAPVGGRLHVVDLPAGEITVRYSATVEDTGDIPAADPTEEELLAATRPSRYADSDTLAALAATELGGLEGRSLLDAVTDVVAGRFRYVLGSSRPTDAASDVLLAGSDVCPTTPTWSPP